MSDKDKATAEKAKNYSAEQEQLIKDSAPLNLEKAKEIGEQIDKSTRSVIAKALSLKVEYVSKPSPVKRPAKETKAEIVAEISEAMDINLNGLEKATASALVALREYVRKSETSDNDSIQTV